MWWKHILYVLILISILVISSKTQEVQIPQGILRGDTRVNRDGGIFYSFKNIPFAKPPVGELRFKAPERAEGWEGTRDATLELPQCVQVLFAANAGQEDCLYLNVYTPASLGDGVLKPVMVYIYGGYFMSGNAKEESFGPKFLMTKDVVTVIANYRVGIFGFLTLDDPNLEVTGNAGMKDQVLALQWVQENIEYFGGDPNNVLLFGGSAGAMSVHFHMLSPLSEGLFHKTISQSGVAITPLIITGVRNNAVIMAEHLDIQTENWAEMLLTLQEMPTENLVNAEIALNSNGYAHLSVPVVEITSNGSTFLEREPMDIIRSGDFKPVASLHGFTNAEGILIFVDGNIDGVSPLIPDLAKFIPLDLRIEPGSEAEQDIVRRFKDFYYDGRESSLDNITGDINFYGDYGFVFPQYRTTQEHLKTTSTPIYLYYFTVETEINIDFGLNYSGAPHGADVYYVWNSDSVLEESIMVESISRSMVDMWTNFAIYGNPTPDGFDYKWEPVEESQINYLHIDNQGLIPVTNVRQENIRLWSEIYDDYYPN